MSRRKIVVPVKILHKDAVLPEYKRPGDAGMDLYATHDVLLEPNAQETVHTGIAMAIPDGYVGLIWDRSGMAADYGIKTLAGVIDSNYRGEVCVVLCNLSRFHYKVEKGDRIAQMIIQEVEEVVIHMTDELTESNRGEAGFGSTGR